MLKEGKRKGFKRAKIMSTLSRETAIVVPVYKNQPSRIELLSLAKCMKVLSNYRVYFITPKHIDTSSYRQQNMHFELEIFEDEYFEGVDGYNRLLLSTQFYKRFNNYKYILIYQLDALIFKNTLDDWVRKDYDYIGAPWLKFPFMAFLSVSMNVSIKQGLKLLFSNKLENPVGNGGLSLRKVSSCIQAIEENKKLLSKWKANEDYYWSYFATVGGRPLAKPSKFEAAHFSVETKPEKAFRITGNELPFGAHDWENHNREFWNNLLWRLNYFGDTHVTTELPKVSIITVANEKKELEKTLESVRDNKYGNTEVIVINSSSDHETLDLMKKNHDIISKWTWASPQNLYDAMNKGLAMATGQYIWFVKAGEQIYGQYILNKIFNEEDLSDVYYGHSLLLDNEGKNTEKGKIKSPAGLSWKSFPFRESVYSGAFIVKKELVPFFDSSYTYSAYFDWQIKVLKKANKVAYTGLILDVFSENTSSKIDIKAFLKERYFIMKKNYGILRSLINQTIAFKKIFTNYLKFGKNIVNKG
jgi:hypothetical protein